MLSATRQNTIMDTMLPAIAGDRRMSRLLAQLVFILAGSVVPKMVSCRVAESIFLSPCWFCRIGGFG